MATPKIGFIGLGRMGGPMSLRLINAGHDLVVFDINTDASAPQKNAGAAVAASSKAVLSRSSCTGMTRLCSPPTAFNMSALVNSRFDWLPTAKPIGTS